MERCGDCKQAMTTARSCMRAAVHISDIAYLRVRFARDQQRRGARCVDCGVTRAGWHHLGCEVERCPRCHSQLVTCGCSNEAAEVWARRPLQVALRQIEAIFERERHATAQSSRAVQPGKRRRPADHRGLS